jgi:hypothetical protein
MSSIVFEVVLHPDPILRRLVAWTGIAALSAGILLIANLQISPPWRCAIGAIWLADSLMELRNLHRGTTQVSALILDSRGFVAATDASGCRHELTLLTGSLVLPGLAWLRVRFGSGKCHAELFTRRHAGPETWHRLQLLWHQAREAFGHPPGP